MKKILFSFLILFSVSLFSHNHWVYVNNYFPEKGEKIKLEIRSGHKFPNSSFIIKEELIQDTFIKGKNSSDPFFIKKGESSWKSSLVINSEGTYTINFSLKRKSGKETLYRGKAIIFSGRNTPYKTPELTGNGLEIQLPGFNSGMKAGDKCKIKIFYNGIPVKSNCTVTMEGKKPLYMNSNKEKFAEFTIKKSGLYSITANYKGKGSSLTFRVR